MKAKTVSRALTTPDTMRTDDPFLEKPFVKAMIYVLGLIPAGLIFYSIFRYAVNIPFYDDYDLILGSLMDFLDSETISEKIGVIFAQHNEHRPAFARLAAIVVYYINGSVDFKLLIIIGNLGLIGIAAVLFLSCRESKCGILCLVPASFIIFQPQNWESIYASGGALGNITGMFFVFLSLYLLTAKGWWSLAFSIAFTAVAAFTYAACVFVLPVGALVLIHQKRYNELPVWLLTAAVVLIVYLSGYLTPTHHPDIGRAVFENTGNAVKYFLVLFGAAMTVTDKGMSITYLLGSLPVVVMVFLTARRYYEINLRLYSMLVFMFGVVVVITVSRSGFGVGQAFASRYRVFTLLILALESIGLLELAVGWKYGKMFLMTVLVMSMFFNIFSFLGWYGYVKMHNFNLVKGAIVYRITGVGLAYPDPFRVSSVVENAARRGVYRLPDTKTLWARAQKDFLIELTGGP